MYESVHRRPNQESIRLLQRLQGWKIDMQVGLHLKHVADLGVLALRIDHIFENPRSSVSIYPQSKHDRAGMSAR